MASTNAKVAMLLPALRTSMLKAAGSSPYRGEDQLSRPSSGIVRLFTDVDVARALRQVLCVYLRMRLLPGLERIHDHGHFPALCRQVPCDRADAAQGHGPWRLRMHP